MITEMYTPADQTEPVAYDPTGVEAPVETKVDESFLNDGLTAAPFSASTDFTLVSIDTTDLGISRQAAVLKLQTTAEPPTSQDVITDPIFEPTFQLVVPIATAQAMHVGDRFTITIANSSALAS